MDADLIIQRVYDEIEGRFANAGNAVRVLLDIVEMAGDGNYLEIGVLHGGSLCAVALWKKELDHKGVCVGVDPLTGFYHRATGKLEDKTGVLVNEHTVRKNIKNFGLDNLELIKAHSPDFETDKEFVVAYIDGNHTEQGVWADWMKVKEITTKFVVFHDYRAIEGVTKAVDRADWERYFIDDYIAVLRNP